MLEIIPVTDGLCDHTDLFLHESATLDDIRLMPDAFLESMGECGDDAVARVIISDYWNELDGADPDVYLYCTRHLMSFIDSQTEPE